MLHKVYPISGIKRNQNSLLFSALALLYMHCSLIDLDFSMPQQDVVFYSNSAESFLNFSIQSDLLVEGNEVTNIYVSNIVINNLNNEKAARIGTNGSTVLIIIDEDGMFMLL